LQLIKKTKKNKKKQEENLRSRKEITVELMPTTELREIAILSFIFIFFLRPNHVRERFCEFS
jgi:hypothetical protein